LGRAERQIAVSEPNVFGGIVCTTVKSQQPSSDLVEKALGRQSILSTSMICSGTAHSPQIIDEISDLSEIAPTSAATSRIFPLAMQCA
jgi:hypothetical protein